MPRVSQTIEKRSLSLPSGVPQEMIIIHALNEIEVQARDELVFDLFPDA